MRLIAIAATAIVMTAATAGSASAVELSCGPAVQNWANGSKTTCPFDSGGQSARSVEAPAFVVVEDRKRHDRKKITESVPTRSTKRKCAARTSTMA